MANRYKQADEQALEEIKPGMEVEATDADLGEADVSKPRVEEVLKDKQGHPQKLIVKKGVIFSKEIEILVDRVEQVEAAPSNHPGLGKVKIEAQEPEVEALGSVGKAALTDNDILDDLEEALPTDDGLRQREIRNQFQHDQSDPSSSTAKSRASSKVGADAQPVSNASQATSAQSKSIWRILGPGFLGGMSGNDATAVTSYAVDGSQNGYGHLWLMLLSTPLWQAVLFACAKIGRITQKGLGDLLRENYGRKVALPVSLLLVIGNVVLIAGDLVAIGSGLELVTGLKWVWFVLPIALGLWYITVYQNFDAIKKIFVILSLAFVTYIITGFLAGADWGAVLQNTFVPHLDFGFASISSAVAILGATMSPYTIFWQVQGEKEEIRNGPLPQQLKTAALDIGSGVVSGNLVSYFIIVVTSATLFTHHQQIQTAADAARALEPLVGPFAKYLFALGLIGAGLVAIPVLLASTSYALAGTFKLPAGLSKRPWQNEGFYLILSIALVASVVVAMLGFDPIQLMFWANIVQAFLAPVLIIMLVVIGNSRKIMGRQRLGIFSNVGLVLTATLLIIAAGLLVFGLVTGQTGS